jgi:hypothetical protein
MRKPVLLLAWLLLGTSQLAAQTLDAGDVRLKLIGRIQSQFNTTSVDEAELLAAGADVNPIPASTFEIRRLRFGAELEYQEWLTGKLELEYAMARLQMRDVYVNFGFDPRLNLRIGQFKKPFSLLQLHSSSMWPLIERGVRIRGLDALMELQNESAGGPDLLGAFQGDAVLPEEQELLEVFGYQNYELGAALHGRFGGFGYTAGVFNGNGSDRAAETSDKSYAARVTYKLPVELPITLGSGLSHREYRVSGAPGVQTADGTAYEFDVEIGAFRRAGLHLLGEVAFGTNLGAADDFLGTQAVLAYFQPIEGKRIDGIELAARASYGDPQRDLDDDSAWLWTPGVNLYFGGRNRLMLNWDFFKPSAQRFTSENALRAQAQLYF